MWSALTRSSGIVATVLAVAALVWGFFFSARATGRRLRPAWWLDLHNWLGGSALAFTGVHVGAAWLDSSSGIGTIQIALPGTAEIGAWGITWGVLAMYLFGLAVFTTWPRRWHDRVPWRVVHLGSVAAVVFAVVHALQSGSDGRTWWMRAGVVALAAIGTYGTGLRVAGLVERRLGTASGA